MPDWSAARSEAEEIVAGWKAPGQPGGAVVLFDCDGPREAIAAGLASIEHGVPFTAETTNRLASISKQLCATLVLRAGFDLTAPLQTFVSDLPDAIGSVPLGRALDMTGALPDMMEVLWQLGVPFSASLQAAEVFSIARSLPGTNATPGTEMAYSNTGWRLAQRALEQHHGTSYRDLVGALGQSSSVDFHFPTDESEVVPGLATGYWLDSGTWRRGRYGMHFSASGGVAASANAVASWASGLMSQRGALDGILARLTAARRFVDGRESAYRLGLVASRLGKMDVVGHGGSLAGYRNHMLMVPALGVGVVMLTNREEEALWPALRVLSRLVEQPLPSIARPPQGLFVADVGPFFAEITGDAISFMGGHERLIDDGAGGLRSIPAYLDMHFDHVGDDEIGGTIGGVRRRLKRVQGGLKLEPVLIGRWQDRTFGTVVTINPDKTVRFDAGGPLGMPCDLTPLPGGRALADLKHGPWRHRPCLWLDPDGKLRVASHRSRVLCLDRMPG